MKTEPDLPTPHRGQRPGAIPRREAAEPIDSRRLFAEANEVTILHAGELYRLRITRNGKLILNK